METSILSDEYLSTFIYLALHPKMTKSKPVLWSKMENFLRRGGTITYEDACSKISIFYLDL